MRELKEEILLAVGLSVNGLTGQEIRKRINMHLRKGSRYLSEALRDLKLNGKLDYTYKSRSVIRYSIPK